MSITNEQARKMAEAMVKRLIPEQYEAFKAVLEQQDVKESVRPQVAVKENEDPWDLRKIAAKAGADPDEYVKSAERQAQKWRDEESIARAVPYSRKGKEERERNPIALEEEEGALEEETVEEAVGEELEGGVTEEKVEAYTVSEELEFRNDMLFERLTKKWTK